MPKTKQRDVTTPHFRLPFQFTANGQRALVNEQDTGDDIIDCVKTILAYPIGSREAVKDFGIPDVLFQTRTGLIPESIRNAVIVWEPRASYNVSGGSEITDEMIMEVLMKVAVRDG
jgi:phage baseplate assembly protein W